MTILDELKAECLLHMSKISLVPSINFFQQQKSQISTA